LRRDKLASSATQAVPPPTVTVPAGQVQQAFTVATNATNLAGSISVTITATAGTVTQTGNFTLQVISIAISPTALSLTANHSQQFTATVTGASDQTVTWSVQEAGGGSVTTSGLYTAPGTTGTFHVIAASAVDPTKKATAAVTVIPKAKDKEKEKEKERKDKDKDAKEIENKGRVLEQMAEPARPILLPGADQMPSASAGAPAGRAFIRPAERPLSAP
jgi:hypothetical protein